jgi:hypothetical protein
MPQFDHAIVYVPEQPGVASARFLDPTADALDVGTLRWDDAGTRSLVYDPVSKAMTWRDIPFQGPEAHRRKVEVALSLEGDGTAKGELHFTGVGQYGMELRQTARIPERLRQYQQTMVRELFSSGEVVDGEAVEVKDPLKPAELRLRFTASGFARKEGNGLRVKVPRDFSRAWLPSFDLATRKQPLNLFNPRLAEWSTELKLPSNATVRHYPEAARLESKCILFERTVTPRPGAVRIDERVRVTCERLAPEEYAEHRKVVDAIERARDQELVLSLPKGKATSTKRPAEQAARNP